MERKKLAVVGTGISGLAAAYFLQHDYEITVFEQNDYIGGHTNTVTVDEDGRAVPIDTGFMVFNETTYPNLLKLFRKLKVEWMDTEMSFSVQHRPTGLEYCGSGLNGLFGQRKNIFSPKHYKLLLEINRFNQESTEILENPMYQAWSMADYIEQKGYSKDFLYKYLAPMSSALWSTPTEITVKFPAVTLVRFFKNHGFLGLNTQFQWLTVKNGSQSYVKEILKSFSGRIHKSSGVRSVRQEKDHAVVTLRDGTSTKFDKVILASHADQSLRILENPDAHQNALLGAFEYQKNIATLHSDATVMPKNKRVWSSWNYVIDNNDGQLNPYCVYYMNRLQRVSDKRDYFISINGEERVNPEKIYKSIAYEHPIFTVQAIKAQKRLPELNENGPVYFCGSYFKYGFHEDALTSSVELCTQLLGRDVWEKPLPDPIVLKKEIINS